MATGLFRCLHHLSCSVLELGIAHLQMSNQTNPLQIRIVVFDSGECLWWLFDRATGVPLHVPTLNTLMRLRTKNLANSTIYPHCLAIAVLWLFLGDKEIDLDERMTSGRLLTLLEVEALVRYCRLRVEEVLNLLCSNVSYAILRPL